MKRKIRKKVKCKLDRPQIKIYEGYFGMRNIYKEALIASCEEEILVYGTVSPAYKVGSYKKLFSLWLHIIKCPKVKIREILDLTKENIKYIDKVKKINNFNHKIKVIPKDFKYRPNTVKMLESDSIIYNDKIALFSSYHDDLYVIVIKNKHIIQIYKDLFEMSWLVGDEY